MPVQKFNSCAAEITTKNKRCDSCFIPYPNKATEITTSQRKLIVQKIREARIHMRNIMSSSNGFLAQSSLSEEQLNLSCLKFFQKKGYYSLSLAQVKKKNVWAGDERPAQRQSCVG